VIVNVPPLLYACRLQEYLKKFHKGSEDSFIKEKKIFIGYLFIYMNKMLGKKERFPDALKR
jgi:hypothetical protein